MSTLNEILETLNPIKKETPQLNEAIEVIEDQDFSYDGFQVVRGEFFAHIYEPSITFNKNKVYVNTTCIRKMPEVEYVQLLVNPEKQMLVVRPCEEEEKDSLKWCSGTSKKKPKQITCKLFFAKIIELMGWNPNHRYKLLGKMVSSNDELIFVFDLTASEVYQRTITEDQRERTSRTPLFPEEWKDSFGLPFDEHRKQLQINIFDGYAVFSLQDESSVAKTEERSPMEGNI